MDEDRIRRAVLDHYTAVAVEGGSCCAPEEMVTRLGYSPDELAALPDEAVMGLGCGSPVRLADISPGERVLDLGSGGGIDVFLAARRAGPTGSVVGVDMSEAMLRRARANAAAMGTENVEFRPGLIEQLPLDDGSVDVILSNCVINLSPDKAAVFAEAFRVLAPGGRMVISDLVSRTVSGPEFDLDSWSACVDGAVPESEYLDGISSAGFARPEVLERQAGDHDRVYSITVRARRP